MAIEIGGVTLETFFGFIALVIAIFLLSALANAGLRRLMDNRIKRSNSKLIARLIQYLTIVVGLYIGIVMVLGLDLTALFASLGLIALAVAFASQQILQNTMAGILIFIQRPIHLEDWVEIGGLPTTGIGRVKDITLSRITLRNADGRIVFIPNSIILNSKVINYTRAGFTEVAVPLRFPVGMDMERVRSIIMDAVKLNPRLPPNLDQEEERSYIRMFNLPQIKLLFDKKPDISLFVPRTLVTGITGSEVMVEIRIWVREIQTREQIISDLLESVNDRLSREGLKLAC